MTARVPDSRIPTLSVMIAAYDAEPYIGPAMESVLAQTYKDFELLVVDDGSTDGTLGILRKYERQDSRVRVIARENRGIFVTRNELLKEARGRYLAIMDADDICMPQRFEKQIGFLESSPDHAAVGSWFEQINAKGQPINFVEKPESHEEIDASNLRGHCAIQHPSAMVRREAMLTVGGYDVRYSVAGDLDLWLRLAEIGKLANYPEALLRYRLHNGAVSETKRERQCDAARMACEAAWKRRGIAGQFELTRHWRPGTDIPSRHEFAVKYGWMSWSNGHRATWWSYACQALRLRPLSSSSWRLMIFGFLKRPVGSAYGRRKAAL